MLTTLKLALKVLTRRKFFTFISLFGISMTLLVLMVAAAVVDNFFAPHAPESRFGRVLVVYRVSQRGPHDTESAEPGYAFYDKIVKPLQGAERTAVFSNPEATALYVNGGRIDTDVKRTTSDYWQIFDFKFLEGRPYSSADDEAGAHVAVITDQLRDKLFGPGPAVGKSFELDGSRFRVIGVVPHVSLTRVAAYADMWLPVGSLASSSYRQNFIGGFNSIVLARSTSDFPKLRQQFDRLLHARYPLDGKQYTTVVTGLDTPFEAMARVITNNHFGPKAPFIVATVGVVLAILFMTLPALNLVTLNLSRILERAPEIGVRKAFGASRGALISQFVTENVVLTLIGGTIGYVLTAVVLRLVNEAGVVPSAVFELNLRVFAAGMFIAAFFGVFSGVYPAWRMSRLNPVNALRGGAA